MRTGTVLLGGVLVAAAALAPVGTAGDARAAGGGLAAIASGPSSDSGDFARTSARDVRHAAGDPSRAGSGPDAPRGKRPVAEGDGGAAATVDHEATKAAISVLRRGGNAVDAAVAAAATLGVTEPFSAGIGGGGFFVYYDAKTRTVHTLDGRETAPATATERLFLDPETGEPLSFEEARVSGLSVGTPGTPLTWQEALDRWGTWSLAEALGPATRVAQRGFTVDETFREHIAINADFFDDFTSSRELFLPGGEPPEVGSRFRNPDLAATYRLLARDGVDAFYTGPLAAEIAETVQHPPVAPDADRVVRPGELSVDDLAAYRVVEREPTVSRYHGLTLYGMGPPSSGGSTVAETLNIVERVLGDSGSARPAGSDDGVVAGEGRSPRGRDAADVLHTYLEASALAFADRNRYVGDPDVIDVPLAELLSQDFADERACHVSADAVLPKPVAPGVPDGEYAPCAEASAGAKESTGGRSTTHLTVADRWGNVVAYTLTIESTGGNTMVVPGRGFLLNNELTDFTFAPTQGDAPDPNLPGPGKRPRSSMSPTIVLEHGRPVLALGTPGGATIITTVSQILVGHQELGLDLPEALAAPRVSSRNSATIDAEPAFLSSAEGRALAELGHEFAEVEEIGAATGLEFLGGNRVRAVAEPVRRGGGSAMVVAPRR